MIKILVAGSKGRMGQSILRCAAAEDEIKVFGTLDKGDSIKDHLQSGAVIIDFTSHSATPLFVKAAEEVGCPMVIGTTGFTDSERSMIVRASKSIPIVLASNMSVGVNLLFKLVQMMSSALKADFDIEVIEKHHRHKKDSPSGTATRLVELIAQEKKVELSKAARYGRSGDIGERKKDEIGIHSIRGGDFVGEHTIVFAGDGETLEITHKASSREIFAKGALKAARWVAFAKPGLYDMQDVLGFR